MDFNSAIYQAALAKQDVMVLGYYPGLAPGGAPIDSCIRAIKTLNPDARIFLYVNSDGQKVQPQAPYASYVAGIAGWWLKSGSALVPSFFPGEMTINNTPYTAPDVLGNTSIDWITRFWACNANVPSAD